MGSRDIYQRFGPKLVEAVVMVMTEEINILRKRQGLSARTEQYMSDSIMVRLKGLPEYQWNESDGE